MTQPALKDLADKFEKLTMRTPGKHLFSGRAQNHPYQYMIDNFPTFNDFHEYFADLSDSHDGGKPLAETLFVIYHDLRDLPLLTSNMSRGIKPQNMEKVFHSMRLLNELSRKKFMQANRWLAQGYTKH